MLKELIWSKLARSCSFNQESRFAKREDSLQAGSGFELMLQSTRWIRWLVVSSRRCKRSQMPREPPKLRSQRSKASHQDSRVSQITSTRRCERSEHFSSASTTLVSACLIDERSVGDSQRGWCRRGRGGTLASSFWELVK